MDNTINLPLVRTKSGAAAFWDEGGYDGMAGRAVVVTGAYGEKLRPYFSYKGEGRRPNAKHALMPLYTGGYIVQVDTNPKETTMRIMQIMSVEADTVRVIPVALARGEKWDDGVPPPKILHDALVAAHAAATRYGNVEPGYAVEYHASEQG